MKKVLAASGIILGAIILSGSGHHLYKDWSLKKEINSYPDYYRQLAQECQAKRTGGCCMSSVQNMLSGNYKLSPGSGCPDGYKRNMLKCIDSYQWCEPVE
jgi:hypothetical protein